MNSTTDGSAVAVPAGAAADDALVAVVIPSYRVRQHILQVIEAIGPECQRIYVVDHRGP